MTKEISLYGNPGGLSEIFQQNKTRFALCRYDDHEDKLIQCHQFVQCRDFMHDAFVAVESNREMSIYGFKFGKANPLPDMETTSLLLEFPDAGTLKNFQDNFGILKDIEDVLGFAPSMPEIVKSPDSKKAVLWLCSDAQWQANAVAFSLFGFILKCLGYPIRDKSKWMEEISKGSTNESHYMNIPWVTWLLNGGLLSIADLYKNYSGWKDQKDAGASRIHNQSGFVTVGNGIWNGKGKVDSWGNARHCLDGYQANLKAA